MFNHENLKGKTAVITGAGGVLCSGFAKDLASQGVKTALLDLNLSAAQKAAEVAQRVNDPAAVILAADTLVELDGTVLGKPGTAERARSMLRALSGREHRVWSGVCIREGEKILAESECTSVHFCTLTDAEIEAYIATGEPLDKAGAYGYQGLASLFVERIEGDFFNVMGLPVCRMGQMLREFDISLL